MALSRPFIDLSKVLTVDDIGFSSDAAAGKNLSYGCILGNKHWSYGQWEPGFIAEYQPSIKFLQLYALCMGIFIWIEKLKNKRIIVHCDNEVVVHMTNNSSSLCKNCMVLIKKLVLKSLNYNLRVFARHLKGISNVLPDRLSRLRLEEFHSLMKGKNWDKQPTRPSLELWPLTSF